MITNHQADVLAHTSSNGRYVTDEKEVISMAVPYGQFQSGLLFDYSPQKPAPGRQDK